MGLAKTLIVKPIKARDANRVVAAIHYSHKVVNNSQVHLGVFLNGRCGGALQFGPSLDKRKLMGLVSGTQWNEFIELNRMAFADWLPLNGESRCIGYAMRWLRKTYPHLKWVVSFADATQCGDGTIYRASGFVLTKIKRNTTIWEAPTGETFTDVGIRTVGSQAEKAVRIFNRTALTDGRSKKQQQQAVTILNRTTTTKGKHILNSGSASMQAFKDAGWRPKPGFQLRYIYFLNPDCRKLLTVPTIPFSKIAELGATMYRGKRLPDRGIPPQEENGGASPT